MKQKRKEPFYELTPLGLLGQTEYDRLLLYFVKNGELNCLVFDGKQLIFTEVKLVPDKPHKGRKK